MLPKHLGHLCCLKCRADLILKSDECNNGRVRSGQLICQRCYKVYHITNYIPRFVTEDGNYSSGFGFQWNKHYRTQYDSYTGLNISEERFFNETKWQRRMLGSLILEAGSGSGRFTVHAASTGATVVSFDYSNAVDANYRNNGHLDNVLIVQASIYDMPFKLDYFDKVFCIGVIQHTPNPRESFDCLTKVTKAGGCLVIDAYRIRPWYEMIFLTKYWIRPVTRHIPNKQLYLFCEWWVNLWWQITGKIVRITGRRTLSWFLLIADYRGVFPLSDTIQKEWSILDTFDMLAPAYDHPQSLESVRSWYESNNFYDVAVQYGYNGIEARGKKWRVEPG